MSEVDGGPPLGLLESGGYTSNTIPIRPGQRLLLATNGLANVRDGKGNAFGDQRADMLLPKVAPLRAEQGLDTILQAIRDFSGEKGELPDDVTLLVIEKR